ncbi:MAG TPA: hypothetical protein VL475_06395 [Planctomycetaceae bacterium]|nr:hypothetical protein [Planctomycetaceae bacterium]
MSSGHVISRTSIFILSYILEKMGLSWHLDPALAKNCVFLGTIGLIAYVAFEFAASRRVAAQQAALQLFRNQFAHRNRCVAVR